MGPIFCQALRPILQAEGLWDNDVRTAWLRFFRIIAHRMKGGYLEGSNTNHRVGNSPFFLLQTTSVVLFLSGKYLVLGRKPLLMLSCCI